MASKAERVENSRQASCGVGQEESFPEIGRYRANARAGTCEILGRDGHQVHRRFVELLDTGALTNFDVFEHDKEFIAELVQLGHAEAYYNDVPSGLPLRRGPMPDGPR